MANYCMLIKARDDKNLLIHCCDGAMAMRDLEPEQLTSLREAISDWLSSLGLAKMKEYGAAHITLVVACADD